MPRDLWIFGYGSLMWRPGFPHLRAVHARLDRVHRAFCVYTVHHRGTPERPGLVLGLDRGGTCEGIAFQVAPEHEAATLAYLQEREYGGGTYPYREAHLPVTLLEEGRPQVTALTFIVDRRDRSYAGRLPLAAQARLIRGAEGISGGNVDYLFNTVRHLAELGIRERELDRLVGLIGPHLVAGRAGSAVLGSHGLRAALQQRPAQVPSLRKSLALRTRPRRCVAAIGG
jgi:cation transport protein ChaC